jgi:hypothetical protein
MEIVFGFWEGRDISSMQQRRAGQGKRRVVFAGFLGSSTADHRLCFLVLEPPCSYSLEHPSSSLLGSGSLSLKPPSPSLLDGSIHLQCNGPNTNGRRIPTAPPWIWLALCRSRMRYAYLFCVAFVSVVFMFSEMITNGIGHLLKCSD